MDLRAFRAGMIKAGATGEDIDQCIDRGICAGCGKRKHNWAIASVWLPGPENSRAGMPAIVPYLICARCKAKMKSVADLMQQVEARLTQWMGSGG
uniref:Uncharacterized protein n=1 Tax=viral metagenome TaxID=1070528 RepID=A0A6M3LE70_9ZZZZ